MIKLERGTGPEVSFFFIPESMKDSHKSESRYPSMVIKARDLQRTGFGLHVGKKSGTELNA